MYQLTQEAQVVNVYGMKGTGKTKVTTEAVYYLQER
jgi:RecA/RadA recombinase